MNVVIGSVLLLLGLQDVRSQKVSIWVLYGLMIAGSIYGLWQRPFSQYLLGCLPGLFLLLFALWQKQVIGMGDAFVAVAYGMVYGWRQTCLWLMFGFCLAAVIGLFFRLFCKRRLVQMPFIPFLAVVHMGLCL